MTSWITVMFTYNMCGMISWLADGKCNVSPANSRAYATF